MALFWGIQEYNALDANNITLIFDSGNVVNISGNKYLYPPQGHPIYINIPLILIFHTSAPVLSLILTNFYKITLKPSK